MMLPTLDTPVALSEMIANRRFWQRTDPFMHFLAYDVFTGPVYRELELAFQEVLARSREHAGAAGALRHMGRYDAYGMTFTPELTGPLSIFVSRPWHDMVASMVGIRATGDINGGLHHHAIGSASGDIHNDLNPGWFVDCPRPDGINVSSPELCLYTHGTVAHPGLVARETVRAVAIIFYLNNPPWSRGDGGETGLYRRPDDPVTSPAIAIPPINNSMVIFECTPFSYHSFIQNTRQPRNSVVMWLHRAKSDVVAQWGEDKIVYWPKR